jgi:hypothetical protein
VLRQLDVHTTIFQSEPGEAGKKPEERATAPAVAAAAELNPLTGEPVEEMRWPPGSAPAR